MKTLAQLKAELLANPATKAEYDALAHEFGMGVHTSEKKKNWGGSEPTPTVTGQRPAFATTAIAAPDSVSSQGSSNARGQKLSLRVGAPGSA